LRRAGAPSGFQSRLLGRRIPYGWWVIGALFLMQCVANGVVFLSFGLFVTPLEGEFGWDRATVNTAMSFAIVQVVTTPLAGRLMDRFGARKVILCSLPVIAASFLVRAGMTDLWQLYLGQALSSGANAGQSSLPVAMILSNWYARKRGRMMGLAMMGANFGGLAIIPFIAWLIDSLGWRTAYLGMAVMALVLVGPAVWLFVRDRPEELGLAADDAGPAPVGGDAGRSSKLALAGLTLREALRTRTFWTCGAVFVLVSFTFGSVFQQVVPHLERIGFDRTTAALVLSALSFFGMCGKFGFSWLTDRLPSRFALMIALGMEIAGLICLTLVGEAAGFVIPFVPLYGTSYASMGAILPILVGETFGLRAFGSIYSAFQVFVSPATAIVTPLVGRVFDVTGSYNSAFYALTGGFAVAILLLFTLKPLPKGKG
jgi:MFS family permease